MSARPVTTPRAPARLDIATLGAALVVVESRAAALAPAPAGAPDLAAAIAAGALDPSEVREVGELTGLENRDRLTVYRSVGVGVQDAAAAALVLRAAARGTELA